MECNRDEALRATELAEKKLAVRDLGGAKKFALKAMHLFPGLDRAKQMLLVVEVHAAAELKCDDWYGILQVDPVADFDSIKKQFRKLALQLHPDKNNLQGAEQAFKLINEAWGVLSDKVQRAIYDVRRNAAAESKPAADANGYNHASAASASAASASASAASASADAAKVRQQQQPSAGRQQESAPPPSGRQQPPEQAPRQGPPSSKGAATSSQGPTSSTQAQDTFWTQCPRCRVQYQYYRTYENFQLLCQRCKEGFVAKDMNVALARGKNKQQESDPPGGSSVKSRANGVKSENFIQLMQQKAREREEKRLRKMEREKKREEKRRLKEALKKLKEEDKRREAMERQMQKQREREEKEARKKSMEALKKKLKRSRMQEEDDDDDDDDEEDEEDEEEVAAAAAALGSRRSRRTRKKVVYRDDIFDEDGQAAKKARTEELNLSEEERAFRKHLAEKGRQYVLKALSVMLKDKSGQKQKAAAAEVVKDKQEVQVTQKEACPVADVKAKTPPEAVETPSECVQNQNYNEVPQSTSSDESGSDAVFFVPDSDFYDFDKDRREEDVQERQVWALYDDADGMPRFYCEIKQVVSRTPFKLRIRWLEQHQPSEMEQKWQEAGFQMTCGRFKLAKRAKPEDQINKFSHAMFASKIEGIFVWVYPVKGEVWALYRDWSAEWLQQGIDAEAASRGGYEMVEVVAAAASSEAEEVAEEGREEIFVTVVNLVKVHGFMTIFARGQGAERTFKRQDLPRFSHRVPAHWMTGEEKPNAPKDCWQLDTAAMPSHLINEAGD